MAEFTFPCPACHKNIQCDDAWVGHQIECPICHAQFTVPKNEPSSHNALVPKPPSQTKLATALSTKVARASFAPGVPTRNLVEKKKKKSNLRTYAALALVLAAIGVVGYMYGLPWWKNRQEERAAAAEAERKAKEPPPPPEPAPEVVKPVLPPEWTLDVAKAVIPDGKINGQIAGTPFVMETARLERTTSSWVLNLRQGAGASPDRGVLIYMDMRAAGTDMPTNKNFSVGSSDRAGAIRQVVRQWKPNPRYAAQQKPYTGYALKLEFGSLTESNTIPTKVFLALPDPEKTVVAGVGQVSTTATVPGAEGVQPQVQTATPEDTAAQQRFRQRYGLQPGQR